MPSMLRQLLSWRTTTQVVALVSGTLVASIVLLTVLQSRSTTLLAQEERVKLATKEGEAVERLLSSTSGDIHSPQITARLQHMTEDVGNTSSVMAIFVTDKDGSILAHSNPRMVGSRYDNRDVYEALETGNVITAKEGEKDEDTEKDAGPSRLDVAAPLRHDGDVVGAVEVEFSLASLEAEMAEFQKDAWLSALLVALTFIPAATFIVARFQRTLERMAITDGLSELYDHRYFRLRLDQELKRAARYGHQLSLILLDIDAFKNYNDSYGHLAGDEAIRKVSQTIKASVREVDLAARYGGEEFVILLPQAGPDQAYEVAERVRKEIDRCFIDDRAYVLTASFGVASYPTDAASDDDLIRCADAALYEAKLQGKNHSCLYSSVPKVSSRIPMGNTA